MDRDREPSLVTTGRTMVADGVSWRDAAKELAKLADGDRGALARAARYWASQLRRRPSDDFGSLAVLRALEAALARTPMAGAGR